METVQQTKTLFFNQVLRSIQNTIEYAFGKLIARWRILQRPMDIPVDKLLNVIYACFVLHNFCEAQKSEIDPVELEVVMQEESRTQLKQDKLNPYNSIQGEMIRSAVTNFFKEYL